MDIKKFFFPDIITIIIFAMIYILFIPITYDNGIRCIMAPCPDKSTGTLISYVFNHGFLVYDFNIAGLIMAYLAACLVAYAIRRRKVSQFR